MKAERLDKILATQNAGTRREVGTMVRAGRVSVNGKVVLRPEYKTDPEHDTVELDGAVLAVRSHLYLMMNKPGGVLSAARDPKAQTVIDLLPPEWRRRGMFPAGRLDKDTEGLLILTDDGEFAHRMLAPKSHVTKWYDALLAHPVTEEDVRAFRTGVELTGMTCLPAGLIPAEGGASAALVKVREGKFHQVKRMFLARGNEVVALRRVRIGDLVLDERLSPGETRELNASELEMVFFGKSL